MSAKDSSRSPNLLLKEVVVSYVYSFSFEEVNIKKTMDALSKKDYVKHQALLSKTPATNTTKNSILEEFLTYDRTYYFPEYLSSERLCYIELQDLEVKFKNYKLKAQVLLSLHEFGVGTLIFVFSNIDTTSFDDLKDLIFLNKIKGEYFTYGSTGTVSRKEANLTQIFGDILSLLEKDTDINIMRSQQAEMEHTINSLPISEEDYNLYVCVFVSDPGSAFTTPEEFVEKNKKEMFELVAIRYHQKENRYYYFSRSDTYIESVIKKLLGNRRHISYFLTEERMTAISVAKYHTELYPYDFRWWIGYLSLLNIVRMQFQLLYELYKRLYVREMSQDPTKMIELRRIITDGLEEYHNLRFPANERTREFVEHCKEAMNLDRFYEVIMEKLNLIVQSIEEYFDRQSQIKTDATTSAVNLLTLILSLSTAIQIVDKFFVNPPIYYYIAVWLFIGIFFFCIQEILLWIKSRRIRMFRIKG